MVDLGEEKQIIEDSSYLACTGRNHLCENLKSKLNEIRPPELSLRRGKMGDREEAYTCTF